MSSSSSSLPFHFFSYDNAFRRQFLLETCKYGKKAEDGLDIKCDYRAEGPICT